jgi:hypothetical protein
MSDVTQGTLPHVKNASRLTMKLMAIKPDDFMDIMPEQIPPSYRGIGNLVGRLKRKYGIYFAVLNLESGNGWRLIRVKDLVTLKTYSNLRPKSKKMEQEKPEPNNNFSDADLAQLIDEKIAFARRDIADLTPRGVTATRLDDLEDDNEDFKEMPSDTERKGDVSLAVNARDTSRSTIENLIGNVRTMAQNTFTTAAGKLKYHSFGFEGMVSLDDSKLSRASKIINRQTIKYATDMTAEGCDAAFLLALQTAVNDFDEKIDDVAIAEKARLMELNMMII